MNRHNREGRPAAFDRRTLIGCGACAMLGMTGTALLQTKDASKANAKALPARASLDDYRPPFGRA